MSKIDSKNDLTLTITNEKKEELVKEQSCTLLTISLNNEGEIFTTFLGAYNKDILKLLEKTQKTYYKGLLKKLKQNPTINMTDDEFMVQQKQDKKTTKQIKKSAKNIELKNKNSSNKNQTSKEQKVEKLDEKKTPQNKNI